MIPADVVSRNISGWWNTVRIGKGARKGIEEGRAVISPDGLVGKTTEVSPFTTEVLLLSDPACRVSAKIKRVDAFGQLAGVIEQMRQGQEQVRREAQRLGLAEATGFATTGLATAIGLAAI